MKDRIRIARKAAGFTQQKLAEEIHLSRNFINQIEVGKENPSDRTIEDIARACNVDSVWIITGEGEMCSRKNKEDAVATFIEDMIKVGSDDFRYRMIKAISQMSQEQVETLANAINIIADIVNDE